MSIDELYPLVTEAIRRAETLEALGAPGARAAHLDVSLLEEKIAELLPPTDPEGEIARRGAVRAAEAASDLLRALQLAARFATEPNLPPSLQMNLFTRMGALAARITSISDLPEEQTRALEGPLMESSAEAARQFYGAAAEGRRLTQAIEEMRRAAQAMETMTRTVEALLAQGALLARGARSSG